ncbi:(5-formylfuran-3-yl)methyl phosphate synthase [Roseixanthobacter glucoisosaccharinicivorans]|uniref:(5-formylfuran-3-yl)methyl phosphate synthase n=1 Tax=Roseixanthobacter glucoisosaccharinicivorans TaxID=3119923 RepID=UPI00372901A4
MSVVSRAAHCAPGLLASVATLAEMDCALAGGADIVDLKDPTRGALGAWAVPDLQAAVARWRALPENRPLLSATVGDHPPMPEVLAQAVRTVGATGVPLVKIGFFPQTSDAPLYACLQALRPLAREYRLIAVLFADQAPDFAVLPQLKAGGFHGAMLDTADKGAGRLTDHLPLPRLRDFVTQARSLGLLTGLAGSLRLEDIAPLRALYPDYLGFRGALCCGTRTDALDPVALARVRAAMDLSLEEERAGQLFSKNVSRETMP